MGVGVGVGARGGGCLSSGLGGDGVFGGGVAKMG